MRLATWTGGLRRLAALWLAALGTLGPAAAQPAFETAAPFALLVDYDTGSVLFEKRADEPNPPASLAKLMTVEVMFDQLAKGKISLDDAFSVSERAWREGGASSGGSTMFLPLNSSVKVRDLIPGIIVQSGNDATIAVAEGLAGSVENFARMMNERARELGLANSVFRNPHGLPHPEQRVTMRDLATLATHLIRERADHYKTFSQTEFTYNDIKQAARNPLLTLDIGADGLKTGYTKESGYGLVASAVRDGRRLILAMNGLATPGERRAEAQKIMEWGFRAFEQTVLFKPGEPVGEARITGGAESAVPLVARGDVRVVRLRGEESRITTNIAYDGPITAPLEQGAQVARLEIAKDGRMVREVPLYAAKTVEQGPLWWRAVDAAVGWVSAQVSERFGQAASGWIDPTPAEKR